MQAAHRVAKNTGILYVRMAITVFISLYSTRLILSALGVADFGLFNLVGGVIAMLGFLNSSMASATQRFISYAQGEGDIEKVKRIFNMSSLLHWGIAILVLLLLEIAGYFFFNGFLKIDPSRVHVAKLIYQFMIISTLFTIISVPYEAVLTSHENMMVYAVIGVIEAVLKLGIAFYITYAQFDHLILYGLLMAVLSIILLIVKRVYCQMNYSECHLNIKNNYNISLLKEVGTFAGWTLLGSFASLISNYGQSVLINLFFGTAINASQGIASQLSGQLGVFALTLQKALNPVIDKAEGSGNRLLMNKFSMFGSKVSFFLIMILYIPFLIELPYIFNIWLKNVPNYVIIFCRLLLIRNLIEQFFVPLSSSISAQGNIKYYQIYSSILLLFPLLFSYFFFKNGFPPQTIYIIFIFYSILASCIILYFNKINCKLNINEFFKNVIIKCTISFILVFTIAIIPIFFLKEGIIRLFIIFLLNIISYLFIVFFIGFNKNERYMIKTSLIFFFKKLNT